MAKIFQEKFRQNSFHVNLLVLINLFFIVLTGSSFGQSRLETSLETINSFPGQWCTANDGYLYGDGLNTRSLILRKRENGQTVETRADVTKLDASFRIENRLYGTSTPGLIFVLVKNTRNQHYLLKSNDGGATIKNVFAFGEGNGLGKTDASDVRILRGLLELGRDVPAGGGKGTLYIGEYNFSHNRIPGSTNDRVRIMKSTDKGDTWTKVVEWNTNGQNQIGHIHAMRQDPYTGDIYICIGDSDTKLGIIKWDGTSQWNDNRTMLQISSMHGFRVFTGLQRYRACDVLFDENYFYTFADTQTPNNPKGSESGIWRGTKDFSSYMRMDNQIYSYDPMHVGWFGEKIGDTFIFTTAREYVDPSNAWKQLNTQVYTSTDGVRWNLSGTIGWRDSNDPTESKYTANVFAYNNKLYIDCFGGAGHSSTIQCTLSNLWNPDDGPVKLHPVYFVGKWNIAGNDNNSGTNADSPKASIKNLLTGSRISEGSRIKISTGTFSEDGIDADWSDPVFKGRGSVILDGRGLDSTIISVQGSRDSAAIRIAATRTGSGANNPFIMKDLELGIVSGRGKAHNNYAIDITDASVMTIRCRIGNSKNDDSPLIRLKDSGARYVSQNSIHDAGKKPGASRKILVAQAPSSYSLVNCLILNAYNAFSINCANVGQSIRNSTFYGIENSALILGPLCNIQPDIENCIFITGAAPLNDQAGITENKVDYNYYNKQNINVTDGGHGPEVGKDPLFVDAAQGNFQIYANSPCANKGVYSPDILTDIMRTTRHNPPCLGAFECIAANSPVPVDTTAVTNPPVNTIDTTVSVTDHPVSDTTVAVTDHPVSDTTVAVTEHPVSDTTVAVTEHPVSDTTVAVTEHPEINNDTSVTVTDPTVPEMTNHGTVTGIDDDQPGNINVYPNPVADYLIIENNSQETVSILVLDIKGMVRLKEKSAEGVLKVDFSQYQKGMYIIKFISSGKTMKWLKVIKI